MTDTTITSTAVKSVTARQIHAGVYALYVTHAIAATPSASQIFLMMPMHSQVTVLDGWVTAAGFTSFSWDLMVGWTYDKSFFVAGTELSAARLLRFHQNIPHTVTLTDSDTFPLTKPLCITVKVCASGTIGATPTVTLMALLQNDKGRGV